MELRREGDQIDVLIGGRPFTTYYVDPAVATPYLSPLRSAQGTAVTRSSLWASNLRAKRTAIVATVASERGIGSGNIRGRVISNTSGTSPPGSIRCKSLQVGHLRYQLWICPGKSPFWKV